MKRKVILAVAAALGLSAGPAWAHDIPNIEHTHAFEQKDYGSYRQGHTVNGPYGSITIWSPRPYTGYQVAPPVRFARPEPITRAPGTPAIQNRTDSNQVLEYGKQPNDRYGD
ncbi:MAG: hypothetical protein ACSLE2_08580 [Lysobacterales bacterium]